MSLGPLDLPGEQFLILYLVLLAVAALAGLVIPRLLRPEGRRQVVEDADRLAYLAGGARRFGDAVVARLLGSGALAMIGRNQFAPAPGAAAASPAEASVLALRGPVAWGEIEQALKPHRQPLARQLRDAGLLVSAHERSGLGGWAALPYLLVFAFGALKLAVGVMRDKPVGFLTLLLLLTGVLALVRYATIDRRTRGGVAALQEASRRAARLKGAPTNAEMGLAVALFGTAVLAGSGYADFHRLRTPVSSSSDSSSSDSGDGGGCGGGCGGCGGGD